MAKKVKILSKEYTSFISRLRKELIECDDDNLVFCPFGIVTLLAQLHGGSGGATKKEIEDLFGFVKDEFVGNIRPNSIFDKEFDLELQKYFNMVNKIFCPNGDGIELNQTFVEMVNKEFSPAQALKQIDIEKNYDAASEINSFLENNTEGRIEDIISPDDLNSETQLILINAIYFDAAWSETFETRGSEQETFYLRNNDWIKVPMMFLNDKYFNYVLLKNYEMEVIEITYMAPNLSMFIFLPLHPEHFDIPPLTTEQLLNTMKCTKVDHLKIPMFKIEIELDLVDKMKKLGLVQAFDKGDADFSGISKSPLCVFMLKHRVIIEVDEQGFKEAHTPKVLKQLNENSPPIKRIPHFIADNPFAFQIVDTNLNFVLLEGRLMDPTIGVN